TFRMWPGRLLGRSRRSRRPMRERSYPALFCSPLTIRLAPDIRAETPKINPQRSVIAVSSPADQLAHDLGGIIHHPHHPCVVKPGGADQAETAEEAPGAVGVGGNKGGRAGERERFVPRADKDTGALGTLGPPEKIDDPPLGFQIVEQKPHPLEVLDRLEVIE